MAWWWPFGYDRNKAYIGALIYAKQKLEWTKEELKKKEYPSEYSFAQGIEKLLRSKRTMESFDKGLANQIKELIGLLENGMKKSEAKVPITK